MEGFSDLRAVRTVMRAGWGRLGIFAVFLAMACQGPPEPAVGPGGPDGNWTQWRGPGRDGKAPWSAAGGLTRPGRIELREVWRSPLGRGFSSATVAESRAYTLFAENGEEYLIALDAATGTEIWRTVVGPETRAGHGNGPRSTPAVDGDRVFALGGEGRLHAFQTTDGAELWRLDLRQNFARGRRPQWGFATSPLLDGRRLYIHGGVEGGAVALDPASGEVVWSAERATPGYASPLLIEAAGRRQLLFLFDNYLAALNPESGERLWSTIWDTPGVNAADPVAVPGDRLLLSSGYGQGAVLLELRRGDEGIEAREVWRHRELRNHFNSSVLVGEYVYGFDMATLKALRIDDGEVLWKKRGFGRGALIAAGNYLVVLGENCRLAVVEANPREFQEIAAVQALAGRCRTAPALAGSWLYLRDQEQVACYRLVVLAGAV